VITQGRHVVEQYGEVAEALIGYQRVPRAVFPCDSVADRVVGKRLSERGIAEFVILNPGAGWGAKRWPAERYGEVAKALARQGLSSVINFGPGEEALAWAAEAASGGAASGMSFPLANCCADRRARLFIGGDTGPMHLAAALNVPVVAIFGPTDPARNGPFGTRSIVLRNPKSPTTLTDVHNRTKACSRSPPLRWGRPPGGCWGAPVAEWSRIAGRIRVPLGFALAGFTFGSRVPVGCPSGLELCSRFPAFCCARGPRVTSENQELTTSGPYAYTRNPLYLGSLIMAVGFAVAARSGGFCFSWG